MGKEMQKEKFRKRILLIGIPVLCIVLALGIVLGVMAYSNARYRAAVSKMDAGNVLEAYPALIALDDYKDSKELADSIYKDYIVAQLQQAKAGDSVFFGLYEQDSNAEKGKEPIEWLVLDEVDNKVLVISKYALDCKKYNDEYVECTWESSSLRKWLNSDFINEAFTDAEKGMLVTSDVPADPNSDYDTEPGNATQDQVFLLSQAEMERYLTTEEERMCRPTDYAKENGAFGNHANYCNWWLRTPGYNSFGATYIGSGGLTFTGGFFVSYVNCAVRPAFWIDSNT